VGVGNFADVEAGAIPAPWATAPCSRSSNLFSTEFPQPPRASDPSGVLPVTNLGRVIEVVTNAPGALVWVSANYGRHAHSGALVTEAPRELMPIVLFNERRAILRLWRRLKQLAADKRALRSFEVSARGVWKARGLAL
jgi:hypothetical protein